jgi:hypothetical protein
MQAPQPHEGGDGAKCGAKFADTPHVIYVEVTGAGSEWKETRKYPCRQAYSLAVSALGRTSLPRIARSFDVACPQ